VLAALDLSDAEFARIGEAARARALSHHTAERRAAELVALLSDLAANPSATRETAGMEA
jgi:hypothetical protein